MGRAELTCLCLLLLLLLLLLIVLQSAMAMAQAPGKQLLMTCFMLWMSGNSLQIFSIMMLSMALWTPLSEIINVQQRFLRFADTGVDMILPKITFVIIHMAGLAMGLYKCNTMGLLPTSTADWIDTSLRTVSLDAQRSAAQCSAAHARPPTRLRCAIVLTRAPPVLFLRACAQSVQVSGGGLI